jgi:hypothetical protein
MGRLFGAWAAAIALAFAVGLVFLGHAGRVGPPQSAPRSVRSAMALRAQYIAARQAEGARDAAYAMRAEGADIVAAPAPTSMGVRVGPHGTVLSEGRGGWSAGLSAVGYGCAGALAPVSREVARAGATPNRADVVGHAAGAAIDEWYATGPLGVEHGFTLGESPCGAASGDVVIEVEVSGLEARARDDGAGVDLVDASGASRLHYTDLWARDAAGAELATRMEVNEGRIALRVDTRQARFPVVVDPLAWFETAEVVAPDPVAQGYFGSAVAISGDVAVVGAPGATVGENAYQGAAYVFVQSEGTWALQQELIAGDGAANAEFGNAVALSGTTAMIAAPGVSARAVYVFAQSAGVWSQTQKLSEPASDKDGFGAALALSGDTAIIGAPYGAAGCCSGAGAAYLFTSAAGVWSQAQAITPSNGTLGGQFGIAVAISGDTAVVGADVGGASNQGAAYVFTQSGGTWSQRKELTASDSAADDFFGASVAVSGNVVVVGAYEAMIGAQLGEGAAYVFTFAGGTWGQTQKLTPSPGQGDQQFGSAVAISGGLVVIGAFDAVGPNPMQGAAHVFVQSASGWTEQQRLVAADGATNDGLGGALGVSGGTVLTGASNVSRGANNQGAAYFFALLPADGTSCAADHDCGSGHCVDGVCCDLACSGQCEACDVGGSVGKCSPVVSGAPHGARPACEGAGTACAGACSPASTNVCRYPPVGTRCGTTCEAGELTSSSCDGSGACVAAAPTACPGGFACAGVTCATGCESDDECKADFVCTGGACVPRTGPTCVDGYTSQTAGGAPEDCGRYACDVKSGSCKQTCASVADCRAPNVCAPSGACIAMPTSDGGGGCSAARAPVDAATWLPLIASIGLIAMRRRRGPGCA